MRPVTECRVLAANRNPVADPMPAETMFPLSELDRMLPLSDTAPVKWTPFVRQPEPRLKV